MARTVNCCSIILSAQFSLYRRDRGEISGNGGLRFSALKRCPASLFVHARRTDVERALSQSKLFGRYSRNLVLLLLGLCAPERRRLVHALLLPFKPRTVRDDAADAVPIESRPLARFPKLVQCRAGNVLRR